MKKYSQGKWEVDDYGTPELLAGISARFVVLSDDGPVAYVYTENDARLLAAAPELLEALNYAIKQVPELGTVPGIASAIAKATGEQQ